MRDAQTIGCAKYVTTIVTAWILDQYMLGLQPNQNPIHLYTGENRGRRRGRKVLVYNFPAIRFYPEIRRSNIVLFNTTLSRIIIQIHVSN